MDLESLTKENILYFSYQKDHGKCTAVNNKINILFHFRETRTKANKS